MDRTFKPLADNPPDIQFSPYDANAPEGHGTAYMYREVGSSRVWAFLSVNGSPYALVSGGNSDVTTVAWLRGAVRGVRFLAKRVVVGDVRWLTPDEFRAMGGTFEVGEPG